MRSMASNVRPPVPREQAQRTLQCSTQPRGSGPLRKNGLRSETDPGRLPPIRRAPPSTPPLARRLQLLRNTLRPTPVVPLAMAGMHLYAKLEYVNPIGSIKDRAAYWILKRAAERGEIGPQTTV